MERRAKLATAISAVIAATFSTVAIAQDHDSDVLERYSEGTSLTVTGSIAEIGDDEFDLKTKSGLVTIEMDDSDRDADEYGLSVGDKVTATGSVDDDFFEGREIEADAVYIHKLDVTFTMLDDMDPAWGLFSSWDSDDEMSTMTGKITSIDDDEFTLSTGNMNLTVETDELDDSPMDDDGYLRLEVGDRVRVRGELEDGWFEDRELEATEINVIR